VGIRARWAAGGCAARYASGVVPKARLKLVVKEPTLRRPTAKQMLETLRSVVRRSAAARSSRRVRRYRCGVVPNARRNSRLKCAGESFAAAASLGTSSGPR